MPNEKLLSVRTVKVNGLEVVGDDLKIDESEAKISFEYRVVETYDRNYDISLEEYREKEEAIREGAKFVMLDGDMVNINQIKYFRKRNFSHRFIKYVENLETKAMTEVIDTDRLEQFKEYLQSGTDEICV